MKYCCAVVAMAVSAGNPLVAQAASLYERHVFFDNSAATCAYYHSEAAVVVPSELEVVDGKAPVETDRFRSPPNALRLKWRSDRGGDWRLTLNVATRYGRRFEFDGDTLSLMVYAEEPLGVDDSPRIGVRDARNNSLPDVPLLKFHGPLAAGKWVELRFPLAAFAGQYEGTDGVPFDPQGLAAIVFAQGLDDRREHTLFVDDVRVIDGGATEDAEPPPTPTGLTIEAGERHFDLAWRASDAADLLSYRIYRSLDGESFEPISTRPGYSNRAVDYVGEPGRTAHYRVTAVDLADNESAPSEPVIATTRTLSDVELLDMVQRACFRFYWEAANHQSGMALEILPGDQDLVAVGASGFGVMAQLAATERGFITREASVKRMLQIVRFLKRADRFYGAWPHFLHGSTGRVNPYFGEYDDGGDLVETAFLIQGLLAARQFFNANSDAEREIRETIDRLWQGVEWNWYRKSADSPLLYWHWSPEHEWHISHPLVGWNETMIVYLLAIASPTHAVPAELWHTGWAGQADEAVAYRRNWSRTTEGDRFTNGNEYYGVKLDVGCGTGGDLFFAQFSTLGFDPRGRRDRYTNYFLNNRNLALINRAYCIDNPLGRKGYGPDCWGRSAGINSGGGKPNPRDDNGTICCSAALGCMPYTPEESMAVLKHLYRDLGAKTWGVYGFHDGFNETENWFDEVYMGLNQAQIVVGIENYRSGLLWRLFMANPEIAPALEAIGFVPDHD